MLLGGVMPSEIAAQPMIPRKTTSETIPTVSQAFSDLWMCMAYQRTVNRWYISSHPTTINTPSPVTNATVAGSGTSFGFSRIYVPFNIGEVAPRRNCLDINLTATDFLVDIQTGARRPRYNLAAQRRRGLSCRRKNFRAYSRG